MRTTRVRKRVHKILNITKGELREFVDHNILQQVSKREEERIRKGEKCVRTGSKVLKRDKTDVGKDEEQSEDRAVGVRGGERVHIREEMKLKAE
jgi:hypothetical protein